MKLTKELQVCIKTGILLAVIGMAKSATERVINRTTEIVTVRYETPKSNVSTTNISVVQEANLTDSPIDYEDSSEEVNDDMVTKGNSEESTTQKYDNSKLLFSYVVPVTSEKAPQVRNKENAEEDDSEDVVIDEEEEEEERGSLEEEEDDDKNRSSESDEEEYTEEDEEERPYQRREDFVGRGEYNDDSDEEHYEAEDDEDDHGRTDDEVSTEKGSTRAPINPWRHSYPQLIQEKRPFFEFTTVQPYSDPRPVSYSSVVYDPDGKSKTELSGSFYKKPLEVVPESGVFPAEEHVSEDTKTVPVTTPPVIEERSIQAPEEENNKNEDEEEEEEEEEDEDYVEAEAVTSNVKHSTTTVIPNKTTKPIQSFPRHNFNWEEEVEDEDYIEPEEVKSKGKVKVRATTPVTLKKAPKPTRKPKTTTPVVPKKTPKPVQPIPKQNLHEEEEEVDYEEPEAVTSNVNYKIQETTPVIPKKPPKLTTPPVPRRDFNWEEEYYDEPEAMTKKKHEIQTSTPIIPKRTAKAIQPIPRQILHWEEEEEYYEEPEAGNKKTLDIQTTTPVIPKGTVKPIKPVPRQNLHWEEEEEEVYEEPEAVTSNVNYEIQESTPVIPKRTLKQVQPRHNFDWEEEEEEEEEEPRTARYGKREYFEETPTEVPDDNSNPKRFNEKTSQQFHDKSNRENYYEQTINTRFGSKERGTSEEDKNYESEVGDLMKPKVEELRHETVQNNVVSEEEDDGEPEEMTEREIPIKKDRNQLYEYLIADGRFRQGVSENKEALPRYVLTTPKEEVVQTEAPTPPPPPPPTTEPPKPTTTPLPKHKQAKPQSYSFGTITKPQSDQFMTFRNGDTNDDTYNKIVSNIQSLFTPTTRRPTSNYEQHFLPSHGNCQHQLPDRHHDSINYESFIKPSQTRPSYEEEESDETEEEEEESPMPKRLPMKTYIVQKRPIPKKEVHHRPLKKPSGVKVTVHPMTYREAKPVMYRNAVFLGPAASPNQVIRKVIYYTPKDHPKKYHYSPTNQIHRIIRPQPPKRDNLSRMLIIRKIEQTPS